MNWDQVAGNWKQMSGLLMKKWGKFTANDLAVAKGNREMLAGSLQEHYGLANEDAQRQLDEFVREHEAPETSEHPEVATEGAPVDMNTLKIGMR